jgi:DNA-binding MarR family transcriptional regulator
VLRIEPATLSGVLERMERDGLILRVADRSDGRRKMIGLNQCGEELAEVVVECSVRARLIAEHGLSPVEIETLREFLKRIIKNLSDH